MQTILTFIARVDPAKLASLEVFLAKIQNFKPTGQDPDRKSVV